VPPKHPRRCGAPNIVGFGIYKICSTRTDARTGDWPIVAFSPCKPHTTLYLYGFPEGDTLVKKLRKRKLWRTAFAVRAICQTSI
jgi:hypothetical protein